MWTWKGLRAIGIALSTGTLCLYAVMIILSLVDTGRMPEFPAFIGTQECRQYTQAFESALSVILEGYVHELQARQRDEREIPGLAVVNRELLDMFYVASVEHNTILACPVAFLREKGAKIPISLAPRIVSYLYLAQRGVQELYRQGVRL